MNSFNKVLSRCIAKNDEPTGYAQILRAIEETSVRMTELEESAARRLDLAFLRLDANLLLLDLSLLRFALGKRVTLEQPKKIESVADLEAALLGRKKV